MYFDFHACPASPQALYNEATFSNAINKIHRKENDTHTLRIIRQGTEMCKSLCQRYKANDIYVKPTSTCTSSHFF